jgi:glycosyltransferase involved in cell wall biosynthesis
MPEPLQGRRIRVLRVITRMIVGGAQENAMLTCELMDANRFENVLVTGAEAGAEGSLIEECRARGIHVETEPALIRNLHPVSDLVATWRLYRRMTRTKWDVVHVHTSKAGILGRIAAWFARVPLVVHTAHGWAFARSRRQHAWVRWLWTWMERICAKMCRWIIVVADSDRREAIQAKVGRAEQFRLIRSGIDLDAYARLELAPSEAKRRAGLPEDGFIVGTVGRLSEQKAPLDLLRAFSRVAEIVPAAHLLFVGDGPLRADVERLIQEMRLAARVHVTGVRRDIPELMKAMDVFALASRWEGLPRVLPQAMASGLPVVATRVDGTAEAVRQGVTGWLVDVGDVGSLASRIAELAADPELARRMGDTARSRAEEFSARRMVRQLEELYEGGPATKVAPVEPTDSSAAW